MRGSAEQCFRKLNGRAWEAHIPGGSSTEEQRSQSAFGAKTLPPSLQLPPSLRAMADKTADNPVGRSFGRRTLRVLKTRSKKMVRAWLVAGAF